MSFREEDVIVKGEYSLAATLGIPEREGTFPAIIIVAGSGNGDRNGNISKGNFEPNMYRDLAHFFCSLGFVTLRADKRGAGNSGGNSLETGMFDLVDDIVTLSNYLAELPIVEKVILLGHSEGCTLITAANAKRPVDGLIFLSGGAEALKEALENQRKIAKQELVEMDGLKGKLIRLTKIYNKVDKQAEKLNQKILSSKEDVVKYQFQKINAKWFREHFNYDVFEDLAKVTCPAIAINGSTDIQITPEKALDLMNYVQGPAEAYVIEGMNHLLKENHKRASVLNAVKDYQEDMEKPLHEELTAILEDWTTRVYKKDTVDQASMKAMCI